MRLLLDTHALLWWWHGDRRLSASAREALESGTVVVSAVSAWEVATKHRIGKLPEYGQAVMNFLDLVARQQFTTLAVSVEHGLRAGGYGMTHADPFDRMLAAQAELEQAVLVTNDDAFAAFPCETLW